MHIVHISHIKNWNDFSFALFLLYCLHCFVPRPSAQLLTYHHLQPSAPSLVLSQAAPGKSADSLRISKGIVPVCPTGTSGIRPSMEETGMTYNTWDCSRRSYTMADWYLSTHSGKRKTWSCKICRICKICTICKIWPDFRGPLYSSSTETKAHSCSCIPASVIVRILNSSSKLQNQILSILSWNTPLEMPGGQINTMSCYWSYALAQMVMMILVCDHHVLYDLVFLFAEWVDKCQSAIVYERREQSQILYVIPVSSILGRLPKFHLFQWGRPERFPLKCEESQRTFPGLPAIKPRTALTVVDGGMSKAGRLGWVTKQ